MTCYIILAILIFVSAICKAIQDTLMFHFETSVFKSGSYWWNPSRSWKNKYAWTTNKFFSWLLQNPLVLITDAWHLFGTIGRVTMFACLLFSPVQLHISQLWWVALACYAEYVLVFHVFFTWIFSKK